jgi:hypothetical protein
VVVTGSIPVRVSVPARWRDRVAITWGNGLPAVKSLRIAACPPSPHRWNAYAGGFFTHTAHICVPLTFTIGRRSETARFGLGQRCDHSE